MGTSRSRSGDRQHCLIVISRKDEPGADPIGSTPPLPAYTLPSELYAAMALITLTPLISHELALTRQSR